MFGPTSIVFAFVTIALAVAYGVYAEHYEHTADEVAPHHVARLTELDRIAIEQAYTQQVMFLFQQWMKDEHEQPARAMRGLRQAQSAYSRAMIAIEHREGKK